MIHRRTSPLLGTTLLALLLAGSAIAHAPEGYQLIKVPAAAAEDRARLAELDAEIAGVEGDQVVLVVPRQDARAARTTRALEGMKGIEVLSEDVDAMFAALSQEKDLGDYHNYDEIVTELKEFASTYSTLCSYEVIGQTVEGRDIPALKISSSGASAFAKPTALFMGCHHAREWISVEVPLAIARNFLDLYTFDPRVKAAIDQRTIWIVPAVNPDGLAYSHDHRKYWRKNRRQNSDGSYGVDPNRNYGYKWGGAGASSSPWSNTYRGPEAFSEPCTQAIRDLARREGLNASISYHSYGELILYPFSYSYDECPDDTVFAGIAQKVAQANDYTPQQSSSLYPSSGDTDDYLYSDNHSVSFTIELANSFIPSPDQIPAITTENVTAALVFLEESAEVFPLVAHEPVTEVSAEAAVPIQVEAIENAKPNFAVEKVTLVVNDGSTETTVDLEEDEENPGTFKGVLPAQESGATVSYYFGITAENGKTGRTPWTHEWSVSVGHDDR